MFDPGAMGTLIIGLDAVRAEAQNDLRSRPVAVAHRNYVGLRVTLARGLRRTAELLERPTVGEAANSTRA